MGLSTTLSNALTGLNAASRGADVVSQNIANARTQGYARREVNLSAQSLGGNGAGVRVDAVTRSFSQSQTASGRNPSMAKMAGPWLSTRGAGGVSQSTMSIWPPRDKTASCRSAVPCPSAAAWASRLRAALQSCGTPRPMAASTASWCSASASPAVAASSRAWGVRGEDAAVTGRF